jgi:hypothetical protein
MSNKLLSSLYYIMKNQTKNLLILFGIFITICIIFMGLIPELSNFMKSDSESFTNPHINADIVYRDNTALDCAAIRYGLQISEQDKQKTNQIAPILGPQNNYPRNPLWGSAQATNDITSRIPDKCSTYQEYRHPIDSGFINLSHNSSIL